MIGRSSLQQGTFEAELQTTYCRLFVPGLWYAWATQVAGCGRNIHPLNSAYVPIVQDDYHSKRITNTFFYTCSIIAIHPIPIVINNARTRNSLQIAIKWNVDMAPTNGLVNGEAFDLKNEPVDASRPMKVRVIGAGFSGILAAIRSVVFPHKCKAAI